MNLKNLLLVIFFLPQPCLAKSLDILKTIETDFIYDEQIEDIAKASMYCHLLNHLGDYSNYIKDNILPRLSHELPHLLQPKWSSDGTLVQVAEAIDYSDLFHVHVRVPLTLISKDQKSLNQIFLNSKMYHLQYHSFESPADYTKKWREELAFVGNSDLQAWLRQLNKYLEELNQSQDSYGYGISSQLQISSPEELSDHQLEKFSQAWLDYLLSQKMITDFTPWYKARLREKLRVLDPKQTIANNQITAHRSVVSTNNRFIVIKPINLDDYIQPANIYFEERDYSPEIDQVISEAEAHGLTHLINDQDNDLSHASFPSDTDWALHNRLVTKLKNAVFNSVDQYHTFKHALESKVSARNHYVFSWNKNYLFSIRYSLHCKPELAALSKTINQEFKIKTPD